MKKAYLALILVLVLFSSGCIANSVEEDSLPGQVLDTFGNFSEKNNSSSFEFSLDSLTGSTLMGPLSEVVGNFEKNVTQQEGVEMKNMDVEVQNITADRATVLINYTIKDNDTGTINQDMTLTFVKEDGQWTLQDPLQDNFDTSRLRQDPRK